MPGDVAHSNRFLLESGSIMTRRLNSDVQAGKELMSVSHVVVTSCAHCNASIVPHDKKILDHTHVSKLALPTILA